MEQHFQIEQIKKFKHDITLFMLVYKFALEEMETKINILKEEFQSLHDYSPIEHINSRLKSPESIMNKMFRKKYDMSFTSIRDNINDVAGIRITCAFMSDIYRVSEMLQKQSDLVTIAVKDYIKNPKPNGYRSLHLLIEVPVFMSDRVEKVCVEVQIRTIAMDFWASLEHKIFYKYNQSVPASLLLELKSAAESANALDLQMERLHHEIKEIKDAHPEDSLAELSQFMSNNNQFVIPLNLQRLLTEGY
ncbi:GTP pyrophosphokinase [Paenibacillus crassostreae]|uniref:GTP pyrophosphokinase n=1 Tax=Paenibacillus crassostreae TaxID=1763538 RepID=A0A167AJF1_9BACL|nr:GTP pyrophosphokinase family protein [Paenibacillus crassostreae]AOZ92383.1 GTP pyrophosphokinase [Paenibacillus crassostreae]OAB71098.1 GTP pyrophosphokinase [Paenibacillus crassostreae]